MFALGIALGVLAGGLLGFAGGSGESFFFTRSELTVGTAIIGALVGVGIALVWSMYFLQAE